MYLFLPSIRVRFKYALVSGICAAVLWELTKRAFYLYVSHAVTIINFYKQIATIPLFFIWIFITWLIILWGCQLSYALQNKKTLSIIQRQESSEGQAYSSFFLGLFALFRLYESSIREPQNLLNSLDAMVEELGMVSMERLEMVVESLISHGFVVEDARNSGTYFLARHAGTISISDVFQVLYEEEFPLEARRVCATFGRTKNISSDITCAIIKELFDHVKNLYGEKTLESVWKDTAKAHENCLEQTLLHSQVQTT
jgi:membrane protein